MGQLIRVAFTFAALVSAGALGVIYAEAALPIINLGKSGGSMAGPFSGMIENIETLIPLLVAFFVAAAFLIWIVGGVKEERKVDRRRVR